MKNVSCPNQECPLHGKVGAESIARHGFYRTRSGRRRRYRCVRCGKTFGSTKRTLYYRLQHRRSTFDNVAALSVEGVSKSAIARVTGISWNTVARWLEKAARACRQFNYKTITGVIVAELQADEIRTFVGGKEQPTWAFAAIEVGSRLCLSTVVGRRSYRNTLALFEDVSNRMDFDRVPLIVTDGFDFYEKVVRRVFGPACLYGQVIKTRSNDRVIKVERRPMIGAGWRFEKALADPEDSAKLNTSFVERLNLTIRQNSAYLGRRTLCHARSKHSLEEHLELRRCYYNFIRPHKALKFGREVRTPAMQAGLTTRRLTFRDVFSSAGSLLPSEADVLIFVDFRMPVRVAGARPPVAA